MKSALGRCLFLGVAGLIGIVGAARAGAADAYEKRVIRDGATHYYRLDETSGTVATNSSMLLLPDYAALVLADGATHYYRLDEAGGTVVTNRANPGTHNGTYTYESNGIALNWPGALVGKNSSDTAAYFNGSNEYCRVVLGNLGACPTRGTIEFWMQAKAFKSRTDTYPNLLQSSGGAGTGFRLEVNAGGGFGVSSLSDSGGLSGYTVGTLVTGQWYHFALTWDIANTNIQGYLNGVQKFNSTCTNFAANFDSVVFGCGYYGYYRPWTGPMDEVAFYSTNLSAAAVSNHFNAGSLTYNGTYTGPYALGQPGALLGIADTAARFDGTNTTCYVLLGNLGARPTRGTIEFWLNAVAFKNYTDNYLDPFHTSSDTLTTGFRYEVSPTGGIGVGSRSETAAGADYYLYGTIVTGQWYHVALTWDSANTNIQGYLNGVQKFNSVCTNFVTTFDQVRIGAGFAGGARPWNGPMDEVALYSTNLSAGIVMEHYKVGALGMREGTIIRVR